MTKLTTDRYQEVADVFLSGKTQKQTGAAFGITGGYVSQILKRLGVSAKNVRPKVGRTGMNVGKPGAYHRIAPSETHAAMAEKYKSGITLSQIGDEYGISRERVRQILASMGLSRFDGGCSIRIFKDTHSRVEAIKAKNEKTEARIRKTWDMSLDDYKAHVAEFGTSGQRKSPMAKYASQRKTAAHRGIAWEFTFATWWKVWLDSGKWDQRALSKHGYVMARYGDGDTSYSPENVYICTQSQNSKDSYIVSPAAVRFANNPRSQRGSGLGYTIDKKSARSPYVAQMAGKVLGRYPTAELAREAYLSAARGEFVKQSLGPVRGTSHDKAKITESDVVAIRSDSRKVREIGAQYGISHGAVSQIRNRKSWTHVA